MKPVYLYTLDHPDFFGRNAPFPTFYRYCFAECEI
jgi:hypothetical protein